MQVGVWRACRLRLSSAALVCVQVQVQVLFVLLILQQVVVDDDDDDDDEVMTIIIRIENGFSRYCLSVSLSY